MSLQLQPLEVADFDILISHASLDPPGDDLVAPPNPVAWPVSTRFEAETRARHCFALQQRRLLQDPTTNFIKVVDTDSGDIVAAARWHFYPQGYDYATEAHWEMAPETPLTPEGLRADSDENHDDAYPPPNFNLALHNHILSSRDSFRPSWIPQRAPCWILMHLVTRPSQRHRGAAALLIRWGMDRARETGASAYLEAGVQGRPVYEKFGFVQVGPERRVDLQDHIGEAGGSKEFVLANMRWIPPGEDKIPGVAKTEASDLL